MPVSETYLGDCMDFMKGKPDKFFDVCLTDFPYGNECDYGVYDDKRENTIALIKRAMPEILRVSKNAVITPGIGLMYEYPTPDWVACWFTPAGIGSSSHGFCCWQPILIYGKDPYLSTGKGRRPDSFEWSGASDEDASFHPCPKPMKLWSKIIRRWVGQSPKKIFDPFLGSGSSRIAAYKLGFDFYGCELDKDYFEAQEKRFAKAIHEPLFQTQPDPVQAKLL